MDNDDYDTRGVAAVDFHCGSVAFTLVCIYVCVCVIHKAEIAD